MGERTGIEWTDSTWNPTTGCTQVSDGCDHCYAERLANRLLRNNYTRKLPVVDTAANRDDPFAVRLWPERLSLPETWKEPRRVFVNSMSDLFHKAIPQSFVRQVFETMLRADWHRYQVLTKRPARAARFVNETAADLLPQGLPRHIWIGTSVENQSVDYRIRHLLSVNAEIRFLSCEPLLAPLRLYGTGFERGGIHWVIVGGESGAKHRSMKREWAISLRDECRVAGVHFFFKQWGGRTPKVNGRLLDGKEWNQMPRV